MASYLAPLWGKKSVIDINFNRIILAAMLSRIIGGQ